MNKKLFNFSLMFFLMLVFSAITSCGSGDDNVVDGDMDQETSDLTENEDLDSDIKEEESETTKDIWAEKFAILYTFVIPILECKIQALLTGIAKLEATVDDQGSMTYTEKICDFSLNVVETNANFYVIFTNESINAIPVGTRHASFSGFEKGDTFTVEQSVDIYGADISKFANPATDDLPTELDDERLVGFEDEIPGVTAKINGFVTGDVYVVLRMIRNLNGTLESAKVIRGSVESDVEMITLGASSPIMDIQLDLTHRDIADLNRFEMIKLDSDMSCEEIYENEENIFSYDPISIAEPLWTDDCP